MSISEADITRRQAQVDQSEIDYNESRTDYLAYQKEQDRIAMIDQAKTMALTMELNDLTRQTNEVLNAVVEWKHLADRREENDLAATLGLSAPNLDTSGGGLQGIADSLQTNQDSRQRESDAISLLSGLDENDTDPEDILYGL